MKEHSLLHLLSSSTTPPSTFTKSSFQAKTSSLDRILQAIQKENKSNARAVNAYNTTSSLALPHSDNLVSPSSNTTSPLQVPES